MDSRDVTYVELAEELDDEERGWLESQMGDRLDPERLSNHVSRRELFFLLWNPEITTRSGLDQRAEEGLLQCRVCGAFEGGCLNETCIRTRVSNKLRLYDWGKA